MSDVQTHVFDQDGKLVVNRVQDVEPVLEHNRALRLHDDGYSPSREMKRVASIPMIVVERWLNEGFDIFDPNNKVELRRRLNSSEWAALRTSEGVF